MAVAAHPGGVLIPKQHTIFEGGNIDTDLDDVGETLAVYRCPRGSWVLVLVLSALWMMGCGAAAGSSSTGAEDTAGISGGFFLFRLNGFFITPSVFFHSDCMITETDRFVNCFA